MAHGQQTDGRTDGTEQQTDKVSKTKRNQVAYRPILIGERVKSQKESNNEVIINYKVMSLQVFVQLNGLVEVTSRYLLTR